MFRATRRRREQEATFEQQKILCADEESAKAEAANQEEQELEAHVHWNYVMRGGQWYALRYLDRPKPSWREVFFGDLTP
ncbi:MAG: hypothetical protein QOK36_3242 [Gaiellales bacterium]|nr:hypothetical protein [Gaiellales bacterium]